MSPYRSEVSPASLMVQPPNVWDRPGEADWPETDLLLKNAEQISAAYELIPLVGPTPADMVNDLVDVWAAINDAPLDQIQADPEEFSAARLLAFDSAMAARAQEVYRLLARRREDGAWAGHTVVCVDRHRLADLH